MTVSAIIGTAPASARDALIARGMYVQYQIPIPKKIPLWQGLAKVNPNLPGLPHDSNGPAMNTANGIGIALITIITALRLCARWRNRSSRLGWDDFFIVLAAIAGNAWLIIQICMVVYGNLGKHAWDGTYEEQYLQRRIGHVNQKMFVVWACLSKISIACFNWRLTGRSSSIWKWIHIACLAIAVSWGISMFLVLMLQCRPVVASFDLVVAGRTNNYKCHVKAVPFAYGLLVSHIVTDFILLAIPIVIVWRLQIQKKYKLQAIIPLSVGALGCAATIMRWYYQFHFQEDDLLYNFKHQNDWSIIDTVVTICVTSLPACYGLISRQFHLYTSAFRSSKDRSDGSNSNDMRQAASPSHQARSNGPGSDTVTGITEHGSKSSISSHTLGDVEAQHVYAEKGDKSVGSERPDQAQLDDARDSEIFSGYGIAMGHPNLRDDYERRMSATSG